MNSKLQSIHIIGSKASGGAERFYARLVNSLAEQSRLLAINPPRCVVSRLIDHTVLQKHVPMRNNQGVASRFRIRRISLKNRPAVVQTYMGRATRLTHIPHGKGLVHIARLGGYYNLKAYRNAHHLIGNTKGICDYLIRKGIPAERVHYIGNFVEVIDPPEAEELAELRRSLNIPEEAFIITCAARFHENKGIPELINAFATLQLKYPNARLILLGDGPLLTGIHNQIADLNLDGRIILPGWRDPAPFYHLADVLTNPSRHEPLGNTILEAWACGKPIIATKTQGAKELITPDEDGLIIPLNDSDALTDGFEQLFIHSELRKSLSDAGTSTLRKRFSKKFITAKYLNLYEKLLGDV